jgi:Protein of unknown function (DUF3093)
MPVADEPRETGLSGARPPDDYEARYMAGEGTFYRDKIKVPWKFFLLIALPIVVQAVSLSLTALSDKPVPPGVFLMLPVTALIMALIGLLFAVLRITVTREEVIVQYGLFGPRIPVKGIRACKAVTYDWKTYGGWGIRRGRDGSWAYNMVGDAGRAVRIEWTDAKGKEHVTLVASPDPEALARAIDAARAAARPKLRVAPDPRLAEFEAEAEAEAEAALLETEQKKKG